MLLPSTAQISIVQDEFSEVYGMLFSRVWRRRFTIRTRIRRRELQRRIKNRRRHWVKSRITAFSLRGLVSIFLTNAWPNMVYPLPCSLSQLNTQNTTFDAVNLRPVRAYSCSTVDSQFTSPADIKKNLDDQLRRERVRNGSVTTW